MKVVEIRGRLHLRGQFPRKDGKPGYSQSSPGLGMADTPSNRRLAERYLRKAEKDIGSGQFDWADWALNTRSDQPTGTWREAIRQLRAKKVERGRTSESTWTVNYWGTLKLMPLDQKVTTKSLGEELGRYERDTYTYKKLYYLLKDIAVLTGVAFPEVGVPTYVRNPKPQDVPNDSEIVEWVDNAPQPYKWHFGMMAAYGLRPHECDDCRLVQDQDGDWLVQVDNETKTGYRTVIPFENEWVYRWELFNRHDMPNSEREQNRNDATSCWLNRWRTKNKIKWRPYMLRHAYAGRLWRLGGGELAVSDAAKLMGHTTKEHEQTYRAWIDPNKIARTVKEAVKRNQVKVRTELNRLVEEEAPR